ncbi:hypothetical protein ACFYWO_01580 [Streptomyces sp. NPDC002932]|uniref:hypothetical protein n=1 Tax=Streptomyces sp. NPDC002932 TaxID=3364672 RepID=UPI00367B8390
MAWRQHIPALAMAAAGINQASAAWDAVSDSFCDDDGWPIDEEGYADGKVKRDAEAWTHVEVFLAHGPEVLAGVRAAADGTDHVEGPIAEDLRRLRGIDTTLERAGQIHTEWEDVMELMDASLPGSRELYAGRAREIRNAEGWDYAHTLAIQGPALVRAGDYFANQTERAQVALARSVSSLRKASPAAPSVPPASNPTAPRRSR